MVELRRMAEGLPGRVVAKLEMRNPCGSVKDRVGVALSEDAERRGVLQPGVTIVEPTALGAKWSQTAGPQMGHNCAGLRGKSAHQQPAKGL